jgi:hypothetical protein
MTRAPSGDHELPSSTWSDRDIARLPGGSQPLKDIYGLSRSQGTSPFDERARLLERAHARLLADASLTRRRHRGECPGAPA